MDMDRNTIFLPVSLKLDNPMGVFIPSPVKEGSSFFGDYRILGTFPHNTTLLFFKATLSSCEVLQGEDKVYGCDGSDPAC